MLRTLPLIIVLLLSGCQSRKVLPQPNSPVILIRENMPPISDTLILNQGKITYTLSLPVVRMFDVSQSVNYDAVSDTQKLKVNGQHAVMRFRVNTLEQWDVLLCAGDTVVCYHKDGYPLITIKNRAAPCTEVNYDRLRRLRFLNGGDAPDVEFQNPSLIYLKSHSDWTQMPSYEELKETARARYIAFLESEKEWLDSLYHQHLVSPFAYRYYSCRNKYAHSFAQLDHKSDTVLKSELTNYADSVYANQLYPFYRQYYDAVVVKLFYGPLKMMAHGIDYNFTEVFDRIEQAQLLKGQLKDSHLFNCFVKIDESASVSVRKYYFDKAAALISDTTILKRLHCDYDRLYANENNFSDDLTLLTTTGMTTTLKEIIAANEGKVLYVDFWASWCAPCMAEMPASKRLRKDYQNKNVVFVYLAFNDKEQAWRKAIPKAELEHVGNVYLVSNPQTSTFVDELRLESIPRYLIFDKTGRLINMNAPRPESNEIRIELNKLLE